ncbi:MAG: hypothetical protein WCH99_12965 [Verrucomicrobiota bacterium]
MKKNQYQPKPAPASAGPTAKARAGRFTVKSAIKEARIKTTPAQYAEQIWKEFAL